MWNSGVATADSLYWHEGMADWRTIREIISILAPPLPPKNTSNIQTTPDAHPPDAQLAKLFLLANAAAEANNQQEAYKYFTQALEHDPVNPDAWFGKGRAIGWMSTINEIKSVEIVAAFSNAIQYAPAIRRNELQTQCAETLHRIVKACHKLNAAHLNTFIKVDGTWPHYIGNLNLLISLLTYAHSCDPGNRAVIYSIVEIAEDTIRSFSFSAGGAGLLRKTFKMPANYVASTRAKIEEYNAKLQAIE
jgi:hypothetical protein